MGRNKLEKPRKTKPYTVRFDIELEPFIKSQKNLSELINMLLWKELLKQEEEGGHKNE